VAGRVIDDGRAAGLRSGPASFGLFLIAHLVLDLAVLGIGAAVYQPPPGGCQLVGCADDGGQWFVLMALIFLLPAAVAGALLSLGAHRVLYGGLRLPGTGWLPRVGLISVAVVAALVALLASTG
jgi:hypothetical protein